MPCLDPQPQSLHPEGLPGWKRAQVAPQATPRRPPNAQERAGPVCPFSGAHWGPPVPGSWVQAVCGGQRLVLGAGSGWRDPRCRSPRSCTGSPPHQHQGYTADHMAGVRPEPTPTASLTSWWGGGHFLRSLSPVKKTTRPPPTPISTQGPCWGASKKRQVSPLSVWEDFLEEEALYGWEDLERPVALQVPWGRVWGGRPPPHRSLTLRSWS